MMIITIYDIIFIKTRSELASLAYSLSSRFLHSDLEKLSLPMNASAEDTRQMTEGKLIERATLRSGQG